MLDSTTLVIAAVTRRLVDQYRHVFGHREPDHAGAIATAARLALERIGISATRPTTTSTTRSW